MRRLFGFSFFYICIFLFCIDEHNPYDDMVNVKAIINDYSHITHDSIKIFSSDTVYVSLFVKGHIDSFSLHTMSNRYWNDTTLYNKNGLLDEYTFAVSFTDTGNKKITVNTFRDDGSNNSMYISCRGYSPLYQEPITGSFDDSITLSTPPVDDFVEYHWDFGVPPLYSSFTPSKKVLVTHAAEDSIGWIWVSDETGNQSPKTTFVFSLNDTTGPRIECINKGYIAGTDTVKTGDTTFSFKLYITDRISDPIKEATINDSLFDEIDINANMYTKILDSMHEYTNQSPMIATVTAYDKEEPPNDSTRIFFIYFDENMEQSPKTIIKVQSVTADVIFTTTSIYSLFGEVINKEHQTIIMRIFLNGVSAGDSITIPDGNGTWAWLVELQQDTINPITITASDTNGIIQAQEQRTIYHDSHLQDTCKPVILSIDIAGMNPVTSITPDITPEISVTAYDKESFVKEVTIAGVSATDSMGYLWSSEVTLFHGINILKIICKDSAGNDTSTSITVTHNTLPFLLSELSFPNFILTDTIYTDTLKPYDFDGDSVVIIDSSAITGLTIDSQTNIITWNTTNATLGKASIKIKLDDTYEDTIIEWHFDVIDSTQTFEPVAFKITEENFPEYLEADKDTFSITLSIKESTGKKPFIFTVYIQDLDTFLIEPSSKDSLLKWSPTIDDTGYHQFVITVTDQQPTSDTLFPAVTVVPKNGIACSLSVECQYPSLEINWADNTLDLAGITDTVNLLYTIHDDDHPLTEHYYVTKKIGNVTQTFNPETTFFTHAVIPKPNEPNDTLFVTVVDKTGEPDTVEIIILHPAVESPTEIDSLLFWFDATDSTTVLDENFSSCIHNQEVFRWIDKPSRKDTLHHTISHPRYYNTADLRAIHFNKSANNALFRDNTVDWAYNPYTVFAVARLDVKDDNKHYCIVSSTEQDEHSFSVGVTGGSIGFLYKKRNPLDSVYNYSITLTVRQNTFYLFSYMKQEIDADSIFVFLNGKQDVINTTGISPLQRNKTFVGTNFANQSDDGWDGDIAEIIVYNRALNPIERRYVELYLAQKHDLIFK